MLFVLSSVAFFFSFISLSEALYFYVTDQPRCFIEEVPSETLVVGSYKNPDFIEWGTTGAEFTGVVSSSLTRSNRNESVTNVNRVMRHAFYAPYYQFV